MHNYRIITHGDGIIRVQDLQTGHWPSRWATVYIAPHRHEQGYREAINYMEANK